MRATPPASSEFVRGRMQRQRRRDTRPELEIRSALHRRGLRFRVDYSLPVLRRRAGIAFPRLHVAIFVDGCFWHGCPLHGPRPKTNARWWSEKIEANRNRDADTDRRLVRAGWVSLRVWEHEDLEAAVNQIAAAVEERMGRGGDRRARRSSYRPARVSEAPDEARRRLK